MTKIGSFKGKYSFLSNFATTVFKEYGENSTELKLRGMNRHLFSKKKLIIFEFLKLICYTYYSIKFTRK